jgi:hypothetical protein
MCSLFGSKPIEKLCKIKQAKMIFLVGNNGNLSWKVKQCTFLDDLRH